MECYACHGRERAEGLAWPPESIDSPAFRKTVKQVGAIAASCPRSGRTSALLLPW